MKKLAPMLLLLLLVGCNQVSTSTSKPSSPDYKCVAGLDEQCASDLWYTDYQKLRGLQKQYNAPQEVADQMSGLAMRLNQQMPPGFNWDEGKQRFVRIPHPLSPVVPPAK